jgi:hypothetical protein
MNSLHGKNFSRMYASNRAKLLGRLVTYRENSPLSSMTSMEIHIAYRRVPKAMALGKADSWQPSAEPTHTPVVSPLVGTPTSILPSIEAASVANSRWAPPPHHGEPQPDSYRGQPSTEDAWRPDEYYSPPTHQPYHSIPLPLRPGQAYPNRSVPHEQPLLPPYARAPQDERHW